MCILGYMFSVESNASKKTKKETIFKRSLYFLVVFKSTYLVVVRYLASIALAIGSLYSSRAVFLTMLSKVLRWPLELFDTTPLGRIVSRFSKDIDTCDTVIPSVLLQFLNTCFGVNKIQTKFYT